MAVQYNDRCVLLTLYSIGNSARSYSIPLLGDDREGAGQQAGSERAADLY